MNEIPPNVSILLASYNGEKYLEDQLYSIINQTYVNWKLWIRDDNSTDSTPKIIEKFIKLDSRINIIYSKNLRLGACQNFAELMKTVDFAEYIMFADQDDVWSSNKIELTISRFLEIEGQHGKQIPILLHTDFYYTDSKLNIIDFENNFVKDYAKEPGKIFNKLISHNYIYGCTIMINRSLMTMSNPIPHCAENHDYWIALVAASIGTIHYMPIKTMLYRQHDTNVSVGLKAKTLQNRIRRNIFNWKGLIESKNKKILQIVALRKHLDEYLPASKKDFIDSAILILNKGGINAIIFACKNGIRRQGLIQSFIYYLSLLKPFKCDLQK